MRADWRRRTRLVKLDPAAVAKLMRPVSGGRRVVDAKPVGGGLANTNYWVALAGLPRPFLLRLYVRDPAAAPKEVALWRLVRDQVPTAEFLYCQAENPVSGHPYAIQRWIEGMPLKTLASRSDATDLAAVGGSVGVTLARIGSFRFARSGLFAPDLSIAQPFGRGGDAFLAFVEGRLSEKRVGARLGRSLTDRLSAFARAQAPLLDQLDGDRLDGGGSLVHGDFGGSNILVTRSGPRWVTAAVLDWEFAHSGTSLFDVGNLFRPPLGAVDAFERGFARGFTDAGGFLPPDWRRIGRLLDLINWLDFLERAEDGDRIIADARNVVMDTLRR